MNEYHNSIMAVNFLQASCLFSFLPQCQNSCIMMLTRRLEFKKSLPAVGKICQLLDFLFRNVEEKRSNIFEVVCEGARRRCFDEKHLISPPLYVLYRLARKSASARLHGYTCGTVEIWTKCTTIPSYFYSHLLMHLEDMYVHICSS